MSPGSGSSRSWAVSTRIRSGPSGQRTAIMSQIEMAPSTVQTVQFGRCLMSVNAFKSHTLWFWIFVNQDKKHTIKTEIEIK